jgi:iron complex outermembrane recepter protein
MARLHHLLKTYSLLLFLACLLAARSPAAPVTDGAGPAGKDGGSVSEGGGDTGDLPRLEDLGNIEVTSVNKKVQRLFRTPAAVYVVTREDIRRSGATSIPEALRMVPGLHVARVDGHLWAISARGFNGQYSNKMLVLMDGRILYSPLFAGVIWDVEDTLLEDIDRIEVIRGPGAMMWGSNAVNGVINIISRATGATQGNLVTAEAGTGGRAITGYRHGGRLGRQLTYRVFGKYSHGASYHEGETGFFHNYGRLFGDNAFEPLGPLEQAGSDTVRGGFRVDWERSDQDAVTVLGDLYSSRFTRATRLPTLTAPFARLDVSPETPDGGSLVGEWIHRPGARSETTLRAAHSSMSRENGITSFRVRTTDVDFEHRLRFERHELYWRAGYREARDSVTDSPYLRFRPSERTDRTYSVTVRDDLALIGDRLTLSAGARVEHNAYTGAEVQPSARLLFTPNSRDTFWAAVSRARRVPTRMDSDVWSNVVATSLFGSVPVILRQLGDPGAKPEGLDMVEAGYRVQRSGRWAIDLAAFHSRYSNLGALAIAGVETEADPVFHYVVPLTRTNQQTARGYGGEVFGQWNVTRRWTLKPGYSLLNLKASAPSLPSPHEAASGTDPQHQFQLRSMLDLARNLQLDTNVYQVGALPGYGIDGYTRLDVRVGWRPQRSVELSVSGQNLLEGRHLEYLADGQYLATEARRGVVVRGTWSF